VGEFFFVKEATIAVEASSIVQAEERLVAISWKRSDGLPYGEHCRVMFNPIAVTKLTLNPLPSLVVMDPQRASAAIGRILEKRLLDDIARQETLQRLLRMFCAHCGRKLGDQEQCNCRAEARGLPAELTPVIAGVAIGRLLEQLPDDDARLATLRLLQSRFCENCGRKLSDRETCRCE